MASHRPRGASLFAVALLLGAAALLSAPARSPGAASAAKAAKAAEPASIGSICEAQEWKAAHPGQALPAQFAEFDRPFPTLSACRSHDSAWDEDAPGPNQPIPFSHKHHAGEWGIECLYCHTGTDRSRAAGVPSVELCMGCHENFPAGYDQLEGIRLLKQYWQDGRSIPWVQIHRLPEHVKFQHQAHVRAGIACQDCHGAVEAMDKLYLVPDTKWWQYGLPAKKLEMGWCVMCHRDQGASQDCLTCHY
ncbi:MAG: cytochrome c3 family protein [Deltaproteobacteria bacterium]|nr:cytochrome c3 family protein [Deltaproteobacteria bacterium]MDD9828096.1 cytochrome c3 family protein [Deltaproteobacteria bacterium]MDD9852356.1 cytochrome c3 family protein [Deltaproteobacteria bacterium]MDD9873669.1 cytochrome c3 family protein [Deltaproteobacteria bacterium]